jgi:hypothetical protein
LSVAGPDAEDPLELALLVLLELLLPLFEVEFPVSSLPQAATVNASAAAAAMAGMSRVVLIYPSFLIMSVPTLAAGEEQRCYRPVPEL